MELRIEKINVSDDKFLVTSLYVKSGDKVSKGDLIYSIESSKAAVDVEAPCDGYVFFADGVEEFSEYPANFLIAQIVDTEDNPFEIVSEKATVVEDNKAANSELPKDVVITNKASELINRLNIPLSQFSSTFISEQDVLDILRKRDSAEWGYVSSVKRVAIIGAGYGAVQVIDLMDNIKDYRPVMLFDDTPEKQQTSEFGIPVVGKIDFDEIKRRYINKEFDYIINSISTNNAFRKKCFDELSDRGVPYCNLIHPSVVIGRNVFMGKGNIILPKTHIGACTFIGNDNFITAGASIEHHNEVGSHCTCGPCLMTSGLVKIGNVVRFGMGVFVEPHVEIGNNCLIASGSIITNNIPDNKIVRNQQKLDIVDKNSKTKTSLGGGKN